MNEFKNVTIVKKANIYFDGKVSSRTVKFDDGSHKTLGFMMPGEYTFGTNEYEVMEMMAGEFDLKLPGEENFSEMKAPCTFEVPANSSFDVVVKTPTDYCCSYIKA
ncbi:MAG: pyrimidine/purine nucleoside phosphorylase [Helicobacteraceae bacterium]|jgi:uncharacterized protein YaiE (UPF0345 family)|nr:pyrimidine/purine nucleoside phosphorylase [Helicobacteraceae bacterium]